MSDTFLDIMGAVGTHVFKIKNRKFQCDSGHSYEAQGPVGVMTSDGKFSAICPTCYAEWLSKNFPIREIET